MNFKTLEDIEFTLHKPLIKGFAIVNIRSLLNDFMQDDSFDILLKNEDSTLQSMITDMLNKKRIDPNIDLANETRAIQDYAVSKPAIMAELSKGKKNLKLLFTIADEILDYYHKTESLPLTICSDELDDTIIYEIINFVATESKNKIQGFLVPIVQEMDEPQNLALVTND